jgi:toluene monooxygenase system protein A
MFERDDWLPLARQLDWEFSYVSERDVYPEVVSGTPWLAAEAWQHWEEPYRTTYREYVATQQQKETAVSAVRAAIGRASDFAHLDRGWLSAVKLHAASLALAEFAAVVGNLRAGRFGRSSAWRAAATMGALDELRHTQIPLVLMHDLVRSDRQFDWTHKFFHTNNWVAIAARHLVDELLLTSDPIEFAIATNFVFETGFTNLQFIGLSAVARDAGDRMFENMLQSIQTDEARHSQIGGAVLDTLMRHDPARAQRLVDKWFWRTWLFFAVTTGFAMDYLTPIAHRRQSFKEFVEEWILGQFRDQLSRHGLALPWYWDEFVGSIDYYHHMVYASAYTYRASVWFDCVLPGPAERAWLAEKYPASWPEFDPIWRRIAERTRQAGPGLEWFTHGTTPVTFCDLCQLVLCGGTPRRNAACFRDHGGKRFIFCSEPCAHIFAAEPERYAPHETVVRRILSGKAPANLLALLRTYFGLSQEHWGKDAARGAYDWLSAEPDDRAVPPLADDECIEERLTC